MYLPGTMLESRGLRASAEDARRRVASVGLSGMSTILDGRSAGRAGCRCKECSLGKKEKSSDPRDQRGGEDEPFNTRGPESASQSPRSPAKQSAPTFQHSSRVIAPSKRRIPQQSSVLTSLAHNFVPLSFGDVAHEARDSNVATRTAEGSDREPAGHARAASTNESEKENGNERLSKSPRMKVRAPR